MRQIGTWMLSPEARQLYLAILHTQSVDGASAQAVEELCSFGLIAPHPDEPGERWLALNPTEAISQRQDVLLGELAQALAGVAALPADLQDLAIAWQYRPHQTRAAGAIEHLEGITAINARISEIAAQTTTEILTAQPGGPRPVHSLELSLPRDLAALRRGVALRTLYDTSVRPDPATSAWARTMTGSGAHIRTTGSPFLRSLVFDRRVAVLSDYTPWTGTGPEPRRALVVEDDGLVHYVAAMFDHEWARASVWKGEQAPALTQEGNVLTPRQQRIAEQLAAGASQATVAAVLQMSERAVQGELATMRRNLGCSSNGALLFQLGRQAGRAER